MCVVRMAKLRFYSIDGKVVLYSSRVACVCVCAAAIDADAIVIDGVAGYVVVNVVANV